MSCAPALVAELAARALVSSAMCTCVRYVMPDTDERALASGLGVDGRLGAGLECVGLLHPRSAEA
eukprot:1375141-Rhodomonas_salina.1